MNNAINNTLENTGENRDEQGRFLSGHSGNYSGKPKGSLSITAKMRKELEIIPEGQKKSYLDELVSVILHKAIVEKDQQMIKTIWAFIDGLPKQTTTISDTEMKKVSMILVEDNELEGKELKGQ